MKRMLFLLPLFCLLSCGGPSVAETELSDVEGYIQDEPGRALEKLLQMSADSLSGAGERGLYSLLLSMALDKNYIDVMSDSLILPATAYYARHGDRYHKFLSRYYQGRVYENAAAYDRALRCYIDAESLLDGSVPGEYEVRLYCAKQRVYQRQFAFEEAAKEILKAKDVSRNLESPEFFFRNALDLTAHYVKTGELAQAGTELDSLRLWMKGKSLGRPSEYYFSRLRTMMPGGLAPKDSLQSWLNAYLSLCSNEGAPYDHHLAADVYLALDEPGLAEEEFRQCAEPEDDYDKILYFATCSELYRRMGDADKALESRYEYERAVERISLGVFNNDVRFLEERHRDEMQKRRSAYIISWMVVLILLLAGASVYGIVRAARKKKEYQEALQNVRSEYSFIAALASQGEPAGEVKEILRQRMEALRPYITNQRILPVAQGRKGLEKLDEDRKTMLCSVGMIYALTYPNFVRELTRYSLSLEEIGMCALYQSGYSSKELADLLARGDIYHLNGAIRAKIGVPVASTKLHIWLKALFEQTRCTE